MPAHHVVLGPPSRGLSASDGLLGQSRLPFDVPPAAAGSQGPEHAHAAPPAHRQMAREHHRVDTAMFHRVQAMIASLQALEPLVPKSRPKSSTGCWNPPNADDNVFCTGRGAVCAERHKSP